jgi:ATP adenylyltransferase
MTLKFAGRESVISLTSNDGTLQKHLARLEAGCYITNQGGRMILTHTSSLDETLTSGDTARGVWTLRQIMNPGGFNLGMNVEKVAGAGVEDHLHLHVVPRWTGDTNFMPLVGGINVIPEHPAATYHKLAPPFRSTLKSGEGDAD